MVTFDKRRAILSYQRCLCPKRVHTCRRFRHILFRILQVKLLFLCRGPIFRWSLHAGLIHLVIAKKREPKIYLPRKIANLTLAVFPGSDYDTKRPACTARVLHYATGQLMSFLLDSTR